MVPNHPRYQLRYTRIFTFRFLEISLSVVKAVVKCNLGVLFYGRSNPEIAHVPRASGVSVLLGSDTGTALPNHPRYQLRYTRMCGECGRRRSARRFGSAILQFIFPIVKRMLRRGRKTSEFAPFPRRTGKGTAARSGSERAAATVSVRPAARSGPAGGPRAAWGRNARPAPPPKTGGDESGNRERFKDGIGVGRSRGR